jgi:aspartate/tyrosine/aromatic aminotransferase
MVQLSHKALGKISKKYHKLMDEQAKDLAKKKEKAAKRNICSAGRLRPGMAAPPPSRAGFFAAAPSQPPAPIFHLTTRFRADAHPRKLNLGVGAYRDDALKPVVFSAVRKAEAALAAGGGDKEYLPIAGLPEFRAAAAALLFGAGAPALAAGRVASAQTLSGTGSLMVGAVLLRRLLPAGTRVFCSDPTWENHVAVVADAGLGALETYRYWDAGARALDLPGWLADLRAMPEGSIVLLHAVAHNPTGADPTPEQWARVADVMAKRRLLPWFDVAYQGFASGDPDAEPEPDAAEEAKPRSKKPAKKPAKADSSSDSD